MGDLWKQNPASAFEYREEAVYQSGVMKAGYTTEQVAELLAAAENMVAALERDDGGTTAEMELPMTEYFALKNSIAPFTQGDGE